MDAAAIKSAMDELSNQLNNLRTGGLSGAEVFGRALEVFSIAALRGDIAPFSALVKLYDPKKHQMDYNKAFFNSRNKQGFTLLHMVAKGGSVNVMECLLENGKVEIDIKDSRTGDTALHVAITAEQYSAAVYLLGRGASPNAENQRRRTPLHCAAKYGHKKSIMLLVSKGANINSVADCGTSLQVAVMNGNSDSVKLLLEKDANRNVMSPDLITPLIASIVARSNECMKMLLEAGADPNIRGSKGTTSLGWAASVGDAEDVKCLLNAGANPNVADNLGMTPLKIAALLGNHQIVTALFLVTSPTPNISEWNIEQVVKHVQSDEATQERKQKLKENILLSIARGADSLKRKDYFDAAHHYSEAFRYDPTDVIPLSKRSLCWALLNEGKLAMIDARHCLALKPHSPKAHLRVGAAWTVLKEFDKAATAFRDGLKLSSNNEELKRALREALEAKRNQPAWAFGPESIDAMMNG